MRLIVRMILAAMLLCHPLGADAQDIITGPKKPKNQTTAPANKQSNKQPKKQQPKPTTSKPTTEGRLTSSQMFTLGEAAYDRKDYSEAAKWYRKAAEQGNAEAQYRLGYMYHLCYGFATDYSEAMKWYRKAAEQGYVRAQCNLGLMYHNGNGVAKDLNEAKRWYQKAADQGDGIGKLLLQELLQELNGL